MQLTKNNFRKSTFKNTIALVKKATQEAAPFVLSHGGNLNKQYQKEYKPNTEPILFNKKNKIVISKPLTYIESDTGKTRHYTPASQEWYNSIYTYNTNYIRNLPVADKNLMDLLKSYFNAQLNKKLLKTNIKFLQTRFKRLFEIIIITYLITLLSQISRYIVILKIYIVIRESKNEIAQTTSREVEAR